MSRARVLLLPFLILSACDDDPGQSGPEPVVLATAPDRLADVTLAGNDLLFAVRRIDGTGNGVYAVPKAGGAVRTLHEATTDHVIRLIGVDATSVYWHESDGTTGAVKAAPLAGGAAREVVEQAGLFNAALDATHVYYGVDVAATGETAISQVPREGGTAMDVGTGPGALLGMLVDETQVYALSAATKTLWKLPKAGGTAEALVTDVDPYTASSDVVNAALLADGTHLYWWDRRGDVMKVAKAGGTPEALGDHMCADAAASDTTSVFWTCAGTAVFELVKAGGAALAMPGTSQARGVAVDADHVYWITITQVLALER